MCEKIRFSETLPYSVPRHLKNIKNTRKKQAEISA